MNMDIPFLVYKLFLFIIKRLVFDATQLHMLTEIPLCILDNLVNDHTHYPIVAVKDWIRAGHSTPYENFTLPMNERMSEWVNEWIYYMYLRDYNHNLSQTRIEWTMNVLMIMFRVPFTEL